MAEDHHEERPHILVIGAGPCGLEAAVSCRHAGFRVTIVEKGATVGTAVRSWSHVRLFSQNSLNNSADGLAALEELGCSLPAPAAFPTGAEYVDGYLEPMARWLSEGSDVKLSSRVVAISRGSFLKGEAIKGAGDHSRDRAPFSAMILDQFDNEIMLDGFAAVIDCTGTYGNGNYVGRGGAPALGERKMRSEPVAEGDIDKPRTKAPRDNFFDTIPDVLGMQTDLVFQTCSPATYIERGAAAVHATLCHYWRVN